MMGIRAITTRIMTLFRSIESLTWEPFTVTVPGDAQEGIEGVYSRVKESEFSAFLEKAGLLSVFFHNYILLYAISLSILSIPWEIMSWMSFFEGSTNSHSAKSSGAEEHEDNSNTETGSGLHVLRYCQV